MRKSEKKNKSIDDSPERLNRLVKGTKMSGDMITESSMRLDGEVVGSIDCSGKFVLGVSGLLNGDLKAAEAEIEGTIEGDISIQDLLILKKTAVINGTIETGRLIIEDGAQIGGTIATANMKKKDDKPKKESEQIRTEEKEETASDVVY